MTIVWVSFVALVIGLLALDLGVFHRRVHAIGMREATGWSAVWISLGLAFTGIVWAVYANPEISGVDGQLAGHPLDAVMAYLASFLLEKMLSVDNLFVMAVLLQTFRIAESHQHRVLYWGILGALALRGVMIGAGVWLVHRFDWLFYLFGAWLVWTGFKLLRESDEEEPDPGLSVRLATRLLPVAMDDDSGRFVVTRAGKVWFTRLALALVAVEMADVMFALDSIPAVLGVMTPPDAFIVYSSNVFAILGLRALYFVLAAALVRFKHLGTAVAVVLVFVGVRMLVHRVVDVPIGLSLAIVAICLAAGVWASIAADRRPA